MTTRIKKQKGCSHPDCGCASCCCSPCVKDCYRIKDYTDSFFTGADCADCSGDCDFPNTWDGVMQFNSDYPELCEWVVDPALVIICLGGYVVNVGNAVCGSVGVILTPCTLTIQCYNADTEQCTEFWSGTKSGSTPAGIFTRIAGCSAGPETIEIEECEGAEYVAACGCGCWVEYAFYRAGTSSPAPYGTGWRIPKKLACKRMFVYEGIHHDGSKYVFGSEDSLTVLAMSTGHKEGNCGTQLGGYQTGGLPSECPPYKWPCEGGGCLTGLEIVGTSLSWTEEEATTLYNSMRNNGCCLPEAEVPHILILVVSAFKHGKWWYLPRYMRDPVDAPPDFGPQDPAEADLEIAATFYCPVATDAEVCPCTEP